MAVGWFGEKSGWIGKVEDVKPVLLKTNRISTGNLFEEEDFYPDEFWNRRISSVLFMKRRILAGWVQKSPEPCYHPVI